MFYSQFILAKKGPLGTIWIAAHLERKLRKNQVADTDIGVSVDSILFPEVPIALRLSSHLLLGVVRIYSRKVNYLFDDCSEALLKVKQAFRSTAVDLPPEESIAPYHSITLPETFDLDDFELPDNDMSQGNYVDHHVSTRDQITLQDTMEGVVYTTQFGLDERFGDGDASQIGLELDEIDGIPAAAEVSEYDQGPSTPGLQEPHLFDNQVDQVINEVDYHNSADLLSTKSTQTDCSLQDNVEHCDVDLHHQDNECLLVELDSKREEQEHLECLVVTKDQENLIPNDHYLTTSLPLMVSADEEYLMPLIPECIDGMISASDVPQKVEDLHDEVWINNEPVVAPLDQTIMECVISGVSLNETVASPSSHVTSDPEDISCKLLSNLDGSQVRESDDQLEDDHTSSKHEVLNDIKIANKMGESCPYDEAQVSNAVSGKPQLVDVETQAFLELKEVEDLNHVSHEAVQPIESHLRPCTSHLSWPCVSSIEGEQCHVSDVSDPALGDRQISELSVCREGRPDLGNSDVQLGSQILTDNQVESINKSAVSDMPEPEKMLSMSYQLGGEPNGLLIESTPDNQSISGSHTGAAGVKCISGKKRSFTESTLTVQSVDLTESYGGAQSKRTAEFIPDDDDLLSSILAGRKSSVLKMKPSPAAPEIASIKRSCSAPRTSALKRKVLMDDMMVLHGDTIRHQLTNAEDIRRMRKNAPCTRHEMLMIQRLFLEDEIFHEPIFTGLSDNLILLRNETFDLTGVKVCDYDLHSSFIEETNDKESYSRINVTEIHGVERNIEPMAVQLQGDAEAQPTEISVLSESHPSEVNPGSNDIDTHGHTNIISLVKEPDNSQNAEMNNGGRNIEVSDVENCSVGHGLELSSLTGTVFENNLRMPNDFVASQALMDNKTNYLDSSIHSDLLSMSTAQVPILEDEFVEDKGDRVGFMETAEHSVQSRTQVQSDSSETNNLYASFATGSKEPDEYTNNQASFSGDLPIKENGNSMLGGLNEDQIVASVLGCDDKDSRSGCMYNENTNVDSLHSITLVLDAKETSLNDEENPVCQETGLQSTVHLEISAPKSPYVDHNDENVMDANDTGFLNVGDDEIIEDYDDFIPCAEGTHLENSGWSSRTRAVAKYLQALFDKEDLHGRKNLELDYILAGKTPKEASRMFFETLVLKTRDYIHVEQTKSFASINIKPRMKLMKSDF